MPITFACPNCAKTLRADESHAGKKAKCSGCKTPVVVPAAGGDVYAVDEPAAAGSSRWDSMPQGPPPVITIAPAPAAPQFQFVRGDPDEDTASEARDRMRMLVSIPPEPWYYKFIAGYAWLLAGLGVLQFVAAVMFVLYLAAMYEPAVPDPRFAKVFPDAAAARGPSVASVVLLPLLTSFGVLLACLAASAPMLLIVDAARNLRVMRYTGR